MDASLRPVGWNVVLTQVAIGCALCGLISVPVQGQGLSESVLPRESDLTRLGLRQAWWGQTVINPNRDQLSFVTADEVNVYAQASSGVITAFNAETGRRLWSQMLGAPDLESFPVASNDDQVLLSIGLQIYSLDKMTGRLMWNLRVPSAPSTSPSIDDHHIYVGAIDGSVYTYDLHEVQRLQTAGMLPQWTRRSRLWRFQSPREIISPPIAHGETLTFASQKGIVYGLAATNKALKFQLETGGSIETPLGYSQDTIYIADSNARLYAVNQQTGRIRWVYSSGAPIRQQPRAVGRQVFIVPHREGLAALDATTGGLRWQRPGVTEFVGASDTKVYGSDIEGNLVILDRQTGQFLGALPLRAYPTRVNNDRTDRLVFSTSGGTLISLREIDADFPLYHLNPERRPLLPEFATDPPQPGDTGDADDPSAE